MWQVVPAALVLAAAVFLVQGCGGDAPVDRPGPQQQPGAAPAANPQPPAFGPAERPKTGPGDLATVAKGNNAFAVDLYSRLAAERKDANLFFSPLSISTALAMTYGGARGNTAAEMRKVLHFGLPDDQLHPAMGALLGDLNSAGQAGGFQLSVANALWAEKSHRFLPDFLALNKGCYGAGLEALDFAGDAEGSRRTINAWVEKQTQDRIRDLLPPGVLDNVTRLVLTNAIYFKGGWAHEFKEGATKDEPFKLGGGKKVTAPTMHQVGILDYAEGRGFKALELPYRQSMLSMLVLLPDKDDGLAALEKTLTAEIISRLKFAEADVTLALPKFTVASTFSLKETLLSLGMKAAFAPGVADLSGIDGVNDPGRRLFILAVIHKAWVDVGEKGTEAAAATAVMPTPTCPPEIEPPKRKRVTFIADHPFIFAIRDRDTGSILFLGRVTDPRSSGPGGAPAPEARPTTPPPARE